MDVIKEQRMPRQPQPERERRRKCRVEGRERKKNGCGVSRCGLGSAGGIKSCMREKQDERKENDEHQRKGG